MVRVQRRCIPLLLEVQVYQKHQLQKHGRVTTPMLAGNEPQGVSHLQTELKLGPICPT
jgi:hypothetical protein